ncbi:MAG: toxin-antitoxin system antitoxin subunit [Egibacteraceae bacterium]
MREKIAVSIPQELVGAARAEVVAGRAASLSAYVTQALAEKTQRDRLVEALDEMDRELGPPSAEDEAWAQRVLGL